MKRSNLRIVMIGGLVVLLFSLSLRPASAAPKLPFVFDTYTLGSNASADDFGWEFTTSDYIIVTDLAYYDYGADGLNVSHAVGLYYGPGHGALSTTLITSTTVLAGTVEPTFTGSTAVSGGIYSTFRYHDITDVILDPGTYRIAGVGGDTSQDSPQNLVIDPLITLGNAFHQTGGLAYPSDLNVSGGPTRPWSGPNFLAVLPEPGSASLIFLAATGFIARGRRRRVEVI